MSAGAESGRFAEATGADTISAEEGMGAAVTAVIRVGLAEKRSEEKSW